MGFGWEGPGRHEPHCRCNEVLEQISRQMAALQSQTAAELHDIKENLMSGLDDLNAAITAMQAEWTTFLADLTTALGNEDSDAAVEAAAQLVQAQTAAIAAEDAVVNPPAAPASDTPPAS
jgi:hypothetical protein